MTDANLMSRLATGDRDAFVPLYERHWKAVYNYAWFLSQSVAEAEDVTQECFLALLKRPRSFDPARAQLRAWLLGIARRQFLNRRRKSVHETGSSEIDFIEPEVQPMYDEELIAIERAEAVRDAIESLPAPQREALYLFDVEGLSLAESAVVLGIEPDAVKARLYRARQRLKRRLRSLRGVKCGEYE